MSNVMCHASHGICHVLPFFSLYFSDLYEFPQQLLYFFFKYRYNIEREKTFKNNFMPWDNPQHFTDSTTYRLNQPRGRCTETGRQYWSNIMFVFVVQCTIMCGPVLSNFFQELNLLVISSTLKWSYKNHTRHLKKGLIWSFMTSLWVSLPISLVVKGTCFLFRNEQGAINFGEM